MRIPFIAFILALSTIPPASADETIRLAVGQRGLWNTSVAELGQRGGIFKKHGLTLDIAYTQGAAETQQAVISGRADIGIPPGAAGVFGAFAKGAPLRIIGGETIGAGDVYWYVSPVSPIRTLHDTDGRTIAYSTNGASTQTILMAIISQLGLRAKPVATGGPAATMVQVLSGLTDVGWAAPPFGLTLEGHGKIRIIGRGSEAHALKDQTVRVLVANAAVVQSQQSAIARFMQAYRETLDWMYADPAVFQHYTAFMGTDEKTMRRARDEFYPRGVIDPDAIRGIDAINAEAVRLKYMTGPLTREQLAELIRIPAR